MMGVNANRAPKLQKSDKESSSATNLLVLFKRRATRPSIPSNIIAIKTSATAVSHLCIRAKRIAVNPAERAVKVNRLGINLWKGNSFREGENGWLNRRPRTVFLVFFILK